MVEVRLAWAQFSRQVTNHIVKNNYCAMKYATGKEVDLKFWMQMTHICKLEHEPE